jgi:V8-like Glu-specific endopeptidase
LIDNNLVLTAAHCATEPDDLEEERLPSAVNPVGSESPQERLTGPPRPSMPPQTT